MGKKKQAKKKTAREPETFEASLAKLESLVADLESGKLGLAASLEQFEAGVEHLSACHQMLQEAERRIELVTGVDDEGRPVTTAFDEDQAESLADAAGRRSGRRSARKKSSSRRGADDPHVDASDTLF